MQTLITKCSSEGGLLKLDITPAGGAAAGIWESGTPGGRPTDIIAKGWTVSGAHLSDSLCTQNMFPMSGTYGGGAPIP